MDGIGCVAPRFNDKWWLRVRVNVVICSSSGVKRFPWITSYSVAHWNAGTAVAGATCTQSADKIVMWIIYPEMFLLDGGSEKHPSFS